MNEREALKLALEALKKNNQHWKALADSGDAGFWSAEETPLYQQTESAITATEEVLAQPEQICGFDVVLDESMPPDTFKLAQPEQEPTCKQSLQVEQLEQKPLLWVNPNLDKVTTDKKLAEKNGLYIALYDRPQRKPLTDEQIYSITGVENRDEMMHRMARNIARTIEAAHGITNQKGETD